MERKLNPDIHIICGKCGCATMFHYYIGEELDDDIEGKINKMVVIVCNNCNTLTYLEDLIEKRVEF